MCSNRTFMELKFIPFWLPDSPIARSNRTFMELKYAENRRAMQAEFSSNRTFMELKWSIVYILCSLMWF